MIPPQKVISTSTSNGVSAVFCAQWYPNVVAQLIPNVAAAESIKVTLQGSMVNEDAKFVKCDEVTINGASTTPTKIVKPVGEYWLYYRLKVETVNANSTIQEAYIGAGGA